MTRDAVGKELVTSNSHGTGTGAISVRPPSCESPLEGCAIVANGTGCPFEA